MTRKEFDTALEWLCHHADHYHHTVAACYADSALHAITLAEALKQATESYVLDEGGEICMCSSQKGCINAKNCWHILTIELEEDQ